MARSRKKSFNQRRKQSRDMMRKRRNAVALNVSENNKRTNTINRTKTRQNHADKDIEQQKDSFRRRHQRLNMAVQKEKQEKNTVDCGIKRKNSEVRDRKRFADQAAKRRKRSDMSQKRLEQIRNTELRRSTRYSAFLSQTKKKNAKGKTEQLSKKMAKTLAQQKRRQDPIKKNVEQSQNSKLKKQKRMHAKTFEENKSKFLQNIKIGPYKYCSCCGGLWFPASLQELRRKQVEAKTSSSFADKVFLDPCNGKHLFCSTCRSSIKNNKIPKLCLTNGLQFPEIPTILADLTTLEERLCSLRLPFLQIRSLGVDKQCGLRGNVVHIPNEISETLDFLPRTLNDSQLIPVQLLRKREHEHSYIFQEIRPKRVLEAAKYLLETPLYRDRNITISFDWEKQINCELTELLNSQNEPIQHLQNYDEENPGGHETIMMENEPWKVISIAPGQGKKPLSITKDLDGEALSYPTLYGGHPRKPTVKLSYGEITKSEIRRKDRRCAVPHKVLHAFKVLQNHQVCQAISIHMRKTKRKFTAQDLLQDDVLQSIISNDLGYKILRNVRTSPAFWESKQKDCLAMIRQLGIPTLFMTLSAAETKWVELIKILAKILKDKELSDDDISQMRYEEKASLIRTDPVTCARYFDYRLRQCFNLLIKPENGIFRPYKLQDFYWRIEFQHRGSPHAHMLLWLDGAPKFNVEDVSSHSRCSAFIDSILTCESKNPEVIHQHHRHTHTCNANKNGPLEKECRFHFPQPPLNETRILLPFRGSYDQKLKARNKCNYKLIKQKLEEIDKNGNLKTQTIDDFLISVNLSYDQYVAALRSSLKRPTVFLKRSFSSISTNAYIEELAVLWKANMDAQFILDPYGCAKYVCSYISKSNGGVSKLLKLAAAEASHGKLKGLEKIRKIGNAFLNFSEISAQEAVYGIMGLPLTKSSRDCIFIPTGPPNERINLVKSKSELERLESDSTDVFVTGLLEQYASRPISLEEIGLAEFASMYQYSSNCRLTLQKNDDVENLESDNFLSEQKTWLRLLGKQGFIRHRRTQRIIRFRRFSEKTDPENFYREQIMLFLPWRNEEVDILSVNLQKTYTLNLSVISSQFRKYNQINFDDEFCEDVLKKLTCLSEETSTDKVYEAMLNEAHVADLGRELGIITEKISISERLPTSIHMNETDFRALINSLNLRQRQFVYHVLTSLQQSKKITEFVYGGAGMGKSVLIKALVQCILRWSVKLGDDPSTLKVLLASPTGKAAYNIQGGTLHNTFFLPVSQYGGSLGSLPEDTRNSLSFTLRNLKAVIIDECSMMSCVQLYQVNKRLQQIFLNADDFGGIPIVLFGDLRQLKPVCGSYLFAKIKGEVGELLGNPLWETFRSFELTEVMRQRDDAVFARALNRLAKGDLTDADKDLFNSRQFSEKDSFPANATYIFGNNADVNEMNSKILSKFKQVYVAKKHDFCEGVGSESAKKALLDSVDSLCSNEAMNLHREVKLAVGAKYMLTINIDVSDGLTNGATGILKKVVHENGFPKLLWIKFADIKIGSKRRKQWRPVIVAEDLEWVPLTPETRQIKRWPGRGLTANRTQFPIAAAEAITVWKAQGDTYQNVVVFTKGMKRKALYVAFSRAQQASGLYIVGGFSLPTIPESDTVETEIRNVQTRAIDLANKAPTSEDILTILMNQRNGTSISKPVHETKFERSTNASSSIQTAAVASRRENAIIRFPFRYSLYQTDLASLDKTQWLTSSVIDAFLDCIQHSTNNVFHNFGSHFIDYINAHNDILFTSSWVEEISKRILAFPYCKDSHWTIVLVDTLTKTITGFDSFNSFRNFDCIHTVRNFLVECEKNYFTSFSDWNCKVETLPLHCVQRNSFDCGVYVCLFAECSAKDVLFEYSCSDVCKLRNYVRSCVLAGRLISII